MRRLVRKLIPHFALEHYWQLKRKIEDRRNASLSTEEVFTIIYQGNKWGGKKGEFSSGSGTTNSRITSSYLSAVSRLALREQFAGLDFVDLGCGDFHVGRQLLPFCRNYVGVDIVKSLIQHNQERFGSEHVNFLHLNIVEDPLPIGEVCFVRQVFQHLSNQQILSVLPKLNQYRWVIITEHYPTANDGIQPNIDKVHGGGIRLVNNSGVYLTQYPFLLSEESIELVLEVEGHSFGTGMDKGILCTYLYKPNNYKGTTH